ncbi:MAG: aldo/keto reductase [Akkermansiaceae bacterium]|nr:aldo/keto reductase [Akkermansiaceae bacterium]
MRKVNIASGVDSSVLGFGCAPILGAVGAKTAQQALGCALDEGVNHFDVARSYGYGEAEAFLGKFFKGRRDEVVIASKFGIRATWKAGLLRPLKPAVRTLRGLRNRGSECKSGGSDAQTDTASEVAEITAPRKDPFHERIAITPEAMVASLDKSLKALRCEYLDVLMVHEPTGKIERMDDLVAKAEDLKQQGKIKAWGLAFDWDTADVHESVFDRFDLLQFNNSPEALHYQQALEQRRNAANIFFSPFRQRQDLSPAEVLQQLWRDFPRSVVLCSMFDPKHISANAQLARNLS